MMTGIDDPYEAPQSPDLEIAAGVAIEDAVEQVLGLLATRGVLPD